MDRKDSNSPKSLAEKGTVRHRGVFDGILVVFYSPFRTPTAKQTFSICPLYLCY